MATFKFVGRDIDIHWNGYDIVGPAETVFSIPDQLYEEFEGDIRGVEPSLTWIDTNEFQTLTNNVSTANLSASLPIALTTTTSGKTISLSSTTALNGYLLAANGSGGTIWTPASTSSLTSVIGVSPISTVISGGTVSVSLNASYSTSTHLHDSDYVNVGGDTMSGQLLVSSASTTSTVGFGEIIVAKGTSYGSITVNATDDHLHLRSKNPIEVLEQSGPTMQGLRARGLGVNSSHTYPTLIDDGITFGEDANLYRVSANALKTDDALEVVGTLTNGGTSVSLSTHTHPYQPSGTYVNSVIGTSPASVSTTSGTSTVSIIAASINSTHLADNAVVAAKIAAAAINSTHIGANAVVLGDIAAGAVDSAALANNAVVAAKIAAAAVGTVAISSGAATSGQLLQANGSGGVAFATVASAGLVINAATQTVISGAMVTSAYNTSAAKTPDTVSAAIALDTTSNRVFQIVARNQITSFSAIDGSAISTATITAVLAAEQLQDMAFGASKLVVITGQTAALNGASKYYVIDPSTLTVQNSGTLVPTGTVTTQGDPKIKFDNALGEFVVFGAYGTTATSVQTGGYIRTINASTYSTRTHDNANWESAWGDGTRTFPVWINVNSANRWAIGEAGARITFWSDSGAATGFATQTGLADFGAQAGTSSQLFIDSSDNTNLIYAEVSDGSGHLSSAFHIKFSEISSAYNSSTIDLSSLYNNARSIDLNNAKGTDLIYKTIGGKQWLVAPVSLVNHVYASTRTSQTFSDISSDFLTDSPWTFVWGANNPSGTNWSSNWTNACDIGYDGTDWYVIHATSNTSFHGVVKQKVRAVQTIDLLGTTVTSPSIVSPGNYFADGTNPISSPKTYPSSVLATFNSGTSADTSSNSLYLVASGATWTLNVYPGFSATGTNTTYATPGRMIIRS
jgi:hypothetical protein